jgi:hypothetical protein
VKLLLGQVVVVESARFAKVIAEQGRARAARGRDWLPILARRTDDLRDLRPVELVGSLCVDHAVEMLLVVAVAAPVHAAAARRHELAAPAVVLAAGLAIRPAAARRGGGRGGGGGGGGRGRRLWLRLHCSAAASRLGAAVKPFYGLSDLGQQPSPTIAIMVATVSRRWPP